MVSRITLQLLGVKIITCRVASLIDIQLKQKDWCQSIETVVCSKPIYVVRRQRIEMNVELMGWIYHPFKVSGKFIEKYIGCMN